MAPFSSYSFQQFTLDELPLGRDTWIMDEAYTGEWEAEWLKTIRGDEEASPYEIGYITPVSIEGVTPAGADIRWYPNTHDRFHVVRNVLPRKAFVWTGRVLRPDQLDVDHCLPLIAGPCSDLWNLMPADPSVNRNAKRHRLPSGSALAAARERVVGWWEQAWERDAALGDRFRREAAAAMPVAVDGSLDELFGALEWRRLRLRQDTQVQEWAGPKTSAAVSVRV